MQMSLQGVLLALDVEFKNNLNEDEIVQAVLRLENAIKKKYPEIKRIYIAAENLAKK